MVFLKYMVNLDKSKELEKWYKIDIGCRGELQSLSKKSYHILGLVSIQKSFNQTDCIAIKKTTKFPAKPCFIRRGCAVHAPYEPYIFGRVQHTPTSPQ